MMMASSAASMTLESPSSSATATAATDATAATAATGSGSADAVFVPSALAAALRDTLRPGGAWEDIQGRVSARLAERVRVRATADRKLIRHRDAATADAVGGGPEARQALYEALGPGFVRARLGDLPDDPALLMAASMAPGARRALDARERTWLTAAANSCVADTGVRRTLAYQRYRTEVAAHYRAGLRLAAEAQLAHARAVVASVAADETNAFPTKSIKKKRKSAQGFQI